MLPANPFHFIPLNPAGRKAGPHLRKPILPICFGDVFPQSQKKVDNTSLALYYLFKLYLK
jgi:hypothetical protein